LSPRRDSELRADAVARLAGLSTADLQRLLADRMDEEGLGQGFIVIRSTSKQSRGSPMTLQRLRLISFAKSYSTGHGATFECSGDVLYEEDI
jgi:hypothetical protein